MIYVSSACLAGDNIAKVVTTLAEAGIKNIELSGGTRYYESIEDDLLALKKRYGLSYAFHAYFPPPEIDFVVNLASCNDEIYNRSVAFYENNILMMKNLGCDVLSIHAGFLVEIQNDEIGKQLNANRIYNTEEAMRRFCKAYAHLEALAKGNEIKLYLENNVIDMRNYQAFGEANLLLMTDYASYQDVANRLQFHLLLDLGHLYVSCQTLRLDFMQEIERFQQHVKWLHISDNNGSRDEHKCLVKGSEIYAACKKMLRQDIPVTLEGKGSIEELVSTYRLVQKLL